ATWTVLPMTTRTGSAAPTCSTAPTMLEPSLPSAQARTTSSPLWPKRCAVSTCTCLPATEKVATRACGCGALMETSFRAYVVVGSAVGVVLGVVPGVVAGVVGLVG